MYRLKAMLSTKNVYSLAKICYNFVKYCIESVILMLPTAEEIKKIDELIKRDIESGAIEPVPADKIFDFLPKKDGVIRIMSFNIRCGDVGVQTAESRYTLVSDTILNGEPDTVGLQEATPEWMEYLKDALSDKYDYVGIPREDDGEYSSIFYLKDKLVISGFQKLPKKNLRGGMLLATEYVPGQC